MNTDTTASVAISILVPTRNESQNLAKCLSSLQGWASEIVVVDSNSRDNTRQIAQSFGAHVLSFDYQGGWPKKRNWALETHSWKNQWVLLLDADEILDGTVREEIARAILDEEYDGYWVNYQIVFLGRKLRFGDTSLRKLSLFRHAKGRYEMRLAEQDTSMADMEIHEHVVVDGTVGRLSNPVRHENVRSLYDYIEKHNQYSNWEAAVLLNGTCGGVEPKLFGTQAERRRALKRMFMFFPGFPLAVFAYTYVIKLGFLDGVAGFYYSLFRFIQILHVKAKIFEMRQRAN